VAPLYAADQGDNTVPVGCGMLTRAFHPVQLTQLTLITILVYIPSPSRMIITAVLVKHTPIGRRTVCMRHTRPMARASKWLHACALVQSLFFIY
jgi:hypothetical protein